MLTACLTGIGPRSLQSLTKVREHGARMLRRGAVVRRRFQRPVINGSSYGVDVVTKSKEIKIFSNSGESQASGGGSAGGTGACTSESSPTAGGSTDVLWWLSNGQRGNQAVPGPESPAGNHSLNRACPVLVERTGGAPSDAEGEGPGGVAAAAPKLGSRGWGIGVLQPSGMPWATQHFMFLK